MHLPMRRHARRMVKRMRGIMGKASVILSNGYLQLTRRPPRVSVSTPTHTLLHSHTLLLGAAASLGGTTSPTFSLQPPKSSKSRPPRCGRIVNLKDPPLHLRHRTIGSRIVIVPATFAFSFCLSYPSVYFIFLLPSWVSFFRVVLHLSSHFVAVSLRVF